MSEADLANVDLTFSVNRDEDGFYLCSCEETGVPSFGWTPWEAFVMALDANWAFFDAEYEG